MPPPADERTPASAGVWRVAWWFVAAVTIVAAAGLQFRAPWSLPVLDSTILRPTTALLAGGLLGIGALRLGASGWLSPYAVLAMSAASALAAALVYPFGLPAAVVAALVAGAAAGFVTARLDAASPGRAIATAALMLALIGVAVAVEAMVRGDPASGRDLSLFLLGDLSLPPGRFAIFGLAAVLIVGMAIARSSDLVAAIALAVAVGAVGPIAFVGWWAARAVRAVGYTSGSSAVASAAVTGGAALLAIDSVQRYLIGGYSFAVNVAVSLVAVPVWLWCLAGDAAGRSRLVLRIIAIALGAVTTVVAVAFTQTIRSAT